MSKQIHLPLGFQFSSMNCGIKASGKKDLSLLCADEPCTAAGVYTQNLVRAASIDWNRAITPCENLRGIVINSGNANACTGDLGEKNNFLMASNLATALCESPEQIAVLSTGVIGQQLPINEITDGISNASDLLGNTVEDFLGAAEGILTTDKSTKIASRQFSVDGKTVNLAGMAKGAGMIGPKMATMLCVVMTDFGLTSKQAQRLIAAAADRSFNCISVEGHTSTNDALMLFASGRSGAIQNNGVDSVFAENLNELCADLARMIPDDGEGATHLVSISVRGANSNGDADRIARCIASSNLVKTAIAGADPNWGRIVSAAGYAGVPIQPAEISLDLNGHSIYRDGQPLEFDETAVSLSIGSNRECLIELVVGSEVGTAVHWTSDLTVDYVRFNSEYTT